MGDRSPAVAGYFYPGDAAELARQLDTFLSDDDEAEPTQAKMVVIPHAGYVYSGLTTGRVLMSVQVPKRVLMLGPKHRRGGARSAVSRADGWRFPDGTVPVDRALADDLISRGGFEADDVAHRDEHSLEVQVPFFRRRNPQISIVPVTLGMHDLNELEELGAKIADTVLAADEPVLISASTDMSHQLPEEIARELDTLALDRLLALDPAGLYETVLGHHISMCGVIPTTAALFAAIRLGATRATLVEYTSSARASGDGSSVVGYAGVTVV